MCGLQPTAADHGWPPLVERIVSALDRPHQIDRFGGLSLGESSYLVDSISLREPDDDETMHFLKPDPAGFYNLPIWIDHAKNENTRRRFDLKEMPVTDGLATCWFNVGEANSPD